jgi:hypothetical protein
LSLEVSPKKRVPHLIYLSCENAIAVLEEGQPQHGAVQRERPQQWRLEKVQRKGQLQS